MENGATAELRLIALANPKALIAYVSDKRIKDGSITYSSGKELFVPGDIGSQVLLTRIDLMKSA